MEIQDGRYFCKIVYVIADPQIYRTFESIKNCQRCDFLKIFVIPGGNATPHKFQRGDTSAPLPNRSGRYQGTTPTTWLNFNTPCKSQLKNAWPFSPTIVTSSGFTACSSHVAYCFPSHAIMAHRLYSYSMLWSYFQLHPTRHNTQIYGEHKLPRRHPH